MAKPTETVYINSTRASFRQQPTADRDEILRALDILTEPGQTVELRVLGVKAPTGDGKFPKRGYFRDREQLADAAMSVTEQADGVYLTINPVSPGLFDRCPDYIEKAPRGGATTDADITQRKWLPLDIDAERKAGTSTSDEEHAGAITFVREVVVPTMRMYGWPDPIEADSGNGAHGLWRINLPNDDESRQLIEDVLGAMAVKFARGFGGRNPHLPFKDEKTGTTAIKLLYKVDVTLSNAARILKLYGTLARKGVHTPDRPHRVARLLKVPEKIEVLTPDLMRAFVAEVKEEETARRKSFQPSQQVARQPQSQRQVLSRSQVDDDFDGAAWFDAFVERHQDKLYDEWGLGDWEPWEDGGKKAQFDICPFDDTHKNKPACLYLTSDGRPRFKCLNASCGEYDWYALRELLGEPKREWEEREARETESGVQSSAAQAMAVQAEKTGDVKLLSRARDLPEAEDLSDVGDATLLEALFCRVLKHTPEIGWLAYDEQTGGWNARDGSKAAERCVRQVLDLRARDAAERVGTDYGKKLFTHAHRACDRVPHIVRTAVSFPHLSAHHADFDKSDWLLGVANGVVDLRTGILSPHAPENMITRVSPVAYHPEATCPRWNRFLSEVLVTTAAEPDVDLIHFVHKACGYSATGSIREEALFLCNGGGKNGKSVALGTLRYVLGDYGGVLDPDELASKAQHSETQPKLVALVGKRLITAIEPKERGYGQNVEALDSVMVRRLTGKDGMQIRTLHQEPFEYYPVWKIWLAMNKLPTIHDDSEGTWRRIKVIPFYASFNGREDPDLEETLKAEAEGILAWVVRGARLWLDEGLGTVKAVEDKSDAYRGKEDPLFAFVRDELVHQLGASVLQHDVYVRYEAWRKEVQDDFDAPWLSSRDFGRKLEAHNIQRKKCKAGQHFLDYRLLTDEDRTAQVVTKVTDRPKIADISHEKSYREKSQNWGLSVTNVTGSQLSEDVSPDGDMLQQTGEASAILSEEHADLNGVCAFCGGPDDTGKGYCRVCAGHDERTVQARAVIGDATCSVTGKPHRLIAAEGGWWRCPHCGGVWALDDLPVGCETVAQRHGQLRYVRWTGQEWQEIAMPEEIVRPAQPTCREVPVLTPEEVPDDEDRDAVDVELERESCLLDLDDDIPF